MQGDTRIYSDQIAQILVTVDFRVARASSRLRELPIPQWKESNLRPKENITMDEGQGKILASTIKIIGCLDDWQLDMLNKRYLIIDLWRTSARPKTTYVGAVVPAWLKINQRALVWA